MKTYFLLIVILFDGGIIQVWTEMALECCHLSKKLDFSRQKNSEHSYYAIFYNQSLNSNFKVCVCVYAYVHKHKNRKYVT